MQKANLQYEFFNAVDGYTFTKEELDEYVSPNHTYVRDFLPGEVGCLISHYLLMKKIVEQNLPYALILEDDVELSPNFPTLLEELEPLIEPGDLISLYASFPELCNLRVEGNINNIYKFVKPESGNLVVGAVAYIITYLSAKKLIQKLLPMHNVVDDWRLWVQEKAVKNFKIVFPHPVDLSDTYSDLLESYGSKTLQIKRFIVDKRIPVISDIILRKRKLSRWQDRQTKIIIDGSPPTTLYI